MRIGSDEIELLRPFAKYSWKFNRMRGWDFVERRGVRIGIDHVLCFSLEGSPTGAEEFVTVALTPTIESMQYETMSETLRRYMHAPQIVIPNCG
ncbi:MAG: hypothetical protein KDK30_00090 [Leptospiraceae bacterium]|nr:hypothetical protein [Leptospiraceae bacterium]